MGADQGVRGRKGEVRSADRRGEVAMATAMADDGGGSFDFRRDRSPRESFEGRLKNIARPASAIVITLENIRHTARDFT